MTLRIAVLVLAALVSMPHMARAFCLCVDCAMLETLDSFQASSGNMKPTLKPGQCFNATMRTGEPLSPDPGDIVIVTSPVRQGQFVSRVIATGGQTVQMVDGRLRVDGGPVELERLADYPQTLEHEGAARGMPRCPAARPMGLGGTCLIPRYRETLPNGAGHEILLFDIDPYRAPEFGMNTGAYAIPDGRYFLLGDHRNDSVDSRFPPASGGFGFLSADDILGIVTEIGPQP